MDIREVLSGLIDYYNANRQVGHTHAACEGARATGAIVITRDVDAAHRLVMQDVNAISVQELSMLESYPILLDNDVVLWLAQTALHELGQLEESVREKRKVLEQIRDSISDILPIQDFPDVGK